MAFITAPSRFKEFREDFTRDTGIKDIEGNMGIYAQYVTARFTDLNHRLLSSLSSDIQELQKVLRKV